ncbi:alpha/beta hydrolase [Microbacterium thalassium]|uniref:Pimeloyl-ACP methyl ester carboxylesterase n=1 Tax=Microbacterium thalassium TaxID=362649 RepID=A0A7X0KT65_9MICO|nr:alpha/beta fold hydrolase [Microbacterium thalassium]MBB6389718.1 pimeloyl-ACP methyl ester carboxylesterase [Microbacterium thalassium]GLK24769.1 acyl-CoA thioester hydrolase [Microbacterium thalassium]
MPESDITIEATGATLAGTFTTPSGAGPFPAALIVAGSGPLDRDGNAKRVPLNASRDLARLLDGQGWATLRFDKRGVGASTGAYLPTGFQDELADVEAALDWLASRPETGPIIVVGHSAGASMAAELARGDTRIAGAIMLAVTAKTGEDTLVWQAQEVAKTLPGFARFVLRVMRTDVATQQRKALDKLKATTGDVVRMQGVRVNAKWMREFMAYDPMPALRDISVPVLALTGTKDVQVDPADLAVVADAVATAETHVLTDVDHILRIEPAPVSNVQHYKKQARNPMAPQVESRIVDWLATVTSPARTTVPAGGGEGDTAS